MSHVLYLQKKVLARICLLSGACNMRKYAHFSHVFKNIHRNTGYSPGLMRVTHVSMEIPTKKDKLHLHFLVVLETS